MGMLNNCNRKMPILRSIHLVATIVILTIIFASTTTTALVSASTSGNTTTITTTNTTDVGGEQEAVSSTNTTTTTNNVSNAALGRPFSFGEGTEANVNPINETHIVVSYLGNRVIIPPNATDVINSTEAGNITINLLPNGLSINQGQAVIMAEDGTAEQEQENVTITFVLLSRTNPDGSGSGTGVTYFSTNSTGQLAFLDNMIAIGQIEYSPAEGINRFREWEWKGGTLPFESGGGASTTGNPTTTNNNVSNAALGNPFMIVDFETASVNPINETYIEISTVNNVTLIPPNATATTTINATEIANTTVNILPNGLALDKGQSLIVTEGDDGGSAEQENATTTFVDISRMSPDGTGSGTGVVFFSTNSTGQLAFLDNMVGINDSEFSQGGGTIRVWEWKGGTLPFGIDGGAPIMQNQTTIMTSALEEEE
jgi:hypothetical protein